MDDKENQKAPKWRGLSQNQTKLFLKGVKKWGIQKKDKIVNENKFPNDFQINEGNCLNIYKNFMTILLTGIYRPFGPGDNKLGLLSP